jgi:hypothetical protein
VEKRRKEKVAHKVIESRAGYDDHAKQDHPDRSEQDLLYILIHNEHYMVWLAAFSTNGI